MTLLLTLLLCLSLAGSSLAAVYEIHADGSGDFATIQEAIDASEDGDEVTLTAGTFKGDGNRDISFRGKAITVRSSSGDPTSCIIDAEASSSDRHRGFIFNSGEGPASLLSGITVTNGYAPPVEPLSRSGAPASRGGALVCVFASPTIENCHFLNSRADWAGGVQFWESNSLMTDCVVAGNHANANGGGVYCSLANSPTLIRVTIYNNSTNGRGAGLVANTCSPVIENCTIAHNGSGIWTINGAVASIFNSIIAFNDGDAADCSGGTAVLECCTVFGNQSNYASCFSGQRGQRGNIELDPLFCDPAGRDYELEAASPCAPFSEPNPSCALTGAWPVTCGPTPTVAKSWGEIKAEFRTR